MKRNAMLIGFGLLPLATVALAAVLGATSGCPDCGQAIASGSTYCGTPEPPLKEQLEVEAEISKGGLGVAAQVTIPVYVHIITDDSGFGDISDETIALQISLMNTAFAGQEAPGGGYNTSFRFQFVSTDRTANSAWFTCARDSAEDRAMKMALRQGSADDLNLYIRDLPPGLGGYGGFPWWYAGDPIMDGPVIDYTGVPGAGPNVLGDLAIHEVGHWLGLYHTFQDGCSKRNDYVADTPAQRNYTGVCPTVPPDTCTGGAYRGLDPTMNFMDYTPDPCKYQFTAGQSARMDSMWATYRAGQ